MLTFNKSTFETVLIYNIYLDGKDAVGGGGLQTVVWCVHLL